MKLLYKLSVTFFLILILCGCKESTWQDPEPLKEFTINKLDVPGADKEKSAFKQWIKYNNQNLNWKNYIRGNYLTPETLNDSLSLGSKFLENNQKPAGNFNYGYNFETREFASGDNQVRHAGAL